MTGTTRYTARMSMPPEVMQALSAGGGGAGAGAPPPDDSSTPPPSGPGAAPLMTPQAPDGQSQDGVLKVTTALKFLEMAMLAFGSHTPDGQAVNKAITMLGKVMGNKVASSQDLMPSEKQAVAGTPPPGAAPPAAGPPPGLPGAPPPGGPPPGM